MNEYIFIYKNTDGRFDTATNPIFIASHKMCRAFKKDKFNIGTKELIKLLNSTDLSREEEYTVNEIKWEFLM